MDHDATTLTDDEIETVWTAEGSRAGRVGPAARTDDEGDTGDDTGDDTSDPSDTSDTGDDSGDDSGDTGDDS